jgi:type II secretory pathway component GspD/PulD (secretin)
MKWSNLSPSMQTFPLLPLLLFPLLNLAVAATPLEIQPGPSAPRTAPPGGAANQLPSTPPAVPEGFIVQAVPVSHRPAAEIKIILSLLVTPGGSVLEQPGGKTLTIVDAPANLPNVLEIKELIDAPAFAGARLEIFAPKKASAEELAAAMTELTRTYLFSVQRNESVPVELIPLPRANQILVVAQSESVWTQVRPWLERVDALSSGSRRRIFVYPLEPKQAVELAEKLPPGKTNSPRSVLDPVTGVLVIYGTAEEFQELKKALNGGREIDAFKQRLAALRQKFTSSVKPAP